MPLTETALLGIACMITNAAVDDREAMMKELTIDEQVVVQKMEKLCVPEKLRQILEAGREEAIKGEANDGRKESQPTFRC